MEDGENETQVKGKSSHRAENLTGSESETGQEVSNTIKEEVLGENQENLKKTGPEKDMAQWCMSSLFSLCQVKVTWSAQDEIL